jgi:hypothetical protein
MSLINHQALKASSKDTALFHIADVEIQMYYRITTF